MAEPRALAKQHAAGLRGRRRQQLYAFGFGLTYVRLMERSRSLVAPMIAHGLSDMLEVGAVMLLSVAWR